MRTLLQKEVVALYNDAGLAKQPRVGTIHCRRHSACDSEQASMEHAVQSEKQRMRIRGTFILFAIHAVSPFQLT